MPRKVSLWVSILAVVLISPAQADFVVTVGNATVTQGGVGTVDVFISGTNPAGDPLSSFGFEFQITSPGTRHLDFRSPQLDAQLGLASYVFAGNSNDAADKTAVGAVHSVSGGSNNQFVGGDDTTSGGNVLVTGKALLVRLDLNAATSAPPVAGDSFTIALLPGPFTGFRDANNTLIPFTTTPGVVTIARAVPEPGAWVAFGTGGGLLLAAVRRSAGRRLKILS